MPVNIWEIAADVYQHSPLAEKGEGML